jgi:hypothetical protein
MAEKTKPVVALAQPSGTAPPPSGERPWLRPLAAVAVAFLLLVAVALAAVAFIKPSPLNYSAAGTPEAALQSWATAMKAHDYAMADRYLSANLKSQGVSFEVVSTAGELSDLTVEKVFTNGDEATAQVDVTFRMGGLPSYSFGSSGPVTLVRESDGWKIDSALGAISPFPDEVPFPSLDIPQI